MIILSIDVQSPLNGFFFSPVCFEDIQGGNSYCLTLYIYIRSSCYIDITLMFIELETLSLKRHLRIYYIFINQDTRSLPTSKARLGPRRREQTGATRANYLVIRSEVRVALEGGQESALFLR